MNRRNHITDARRDGETLSRRRALGLGGAAIVGASVTSGLSSESVSARSVVAQQAEAAKPTALDALRPEILPRSAWAEDLPVVGNIEVEDDVRFLLVHHTASGNDYGPDEVAGQIRNFYGLHTGPEKGWPDVAYNFFVDRFGTIWEARAGSIDGAVQGDATGGSQGFALLCSLIGNHAEVEVTPEAQQSMVQLLAWLAERHDVDTSPGATVEFVSRGSNRWAAGSTVTAATISGHRDMSQTTCPGDFAYNLLPVTFPEQVTAVRAGAAAALAAQESAEALTTTQTSAQVTVVPPPSAPTTTQVAERAAPALDDDPTSRLPGGRPAAVAGATATAVAVIAAGAARLRRRVPRSG